MIICANCHEEMRCERNGVIATWNNTHRYAGDLYKCRACGAKTLVTNPIPYYSEESITEKHELIMED